MFTVSRRKESFAISKFRRNFGKGTKFLSNCAKFLITPNLSDKVIFRLNHKPWMVYTARDTHLLASCLATTGNSYKKKEKNGPGPGAGFKLFGLFLIFLLEKEPCSERNSFEKKPKDFTRFLQSRVNMFFYKHIIFYYFFVPF
jgi:hypothetical protein